MCNEETIHVRIKNVDLRKQKNIFYSLLIASLWKLFSCLNIFFIHITFKGSIVVAIFRLYWFSYVQYMYLHIALKYFWHKVTGVEEGLHVKVRHFFWQILWNNTQEAKIPHCTRTVLYQIYIWIMDEIGLSKCEIHHYSIMLFYTSDK